MTDSLRVILEIGKKKRVVAGAMDWPGLDRWGTSEDGAIEKMMSYRPRYAGVAERAGMAKAFTKAGDPEVVERVPGVGSTDFWGIAHAPSEIEREVLSKADQKSVEPTPGTRSAISGSPALENALVMPALSATPA